MTDVEYAMMRENIDSFKQRIVEFLRGEDQSWPCIYCGHPRQPPDDGWWPASDLREAVQISGPSAMMAINELVGNELEMNSRLQVRSFRDDA